jgi:hypothetical protein
MPIVMNGTFKTENCLKSFLTKILPSDYIDEAMIIQALQQLKCVSTADEDGLIKYVRSKVTN